MAYATATDVTDRLAEADLPEELMTLINVRLEDVERMLNRRVDLAAGITLGTFLEDDVIQIEADAVVRIAQNPKGYLSETDGNYTYMLRQDLSSGKLEITDEEWEILGVTTNGMFLIIPTPVMPT